MTQLLLADATDAVAIWGTGLLGALVAGVIGWITVTISVSLAKRADQKQDQDRAVEAARKEATLTATLAAMQKELIEVKEQLSDIWQRLSELTTNPHHNCQQTAKLATLEERQQSQGREIDRITTALRSCKACSEAMRNG